MMMIRDPSLFKFCPRVNSGVNAGPAAAAGRRSGGPQASRSGLGRRRGSADFEASRSGLPGAAGKPFSRPTVTAFLAGLVSRAGER